MRNDPCFLGLAPAFGLECGLSTQTLQVGIDVFRRANGQPCRDIDKAIAKVDVMYTANGIPRLFGQ